MLPLLATKTREKVIIADSSDLRINDCKTAFKQNSLQRLTKERQRNTHRERPRLRKRKRYAETETESKKEMSSCQRLLGNLISVQTLFV